MAEKHVRAWFYKCEHGHLIRSPVEIEKCLGMKRGGKLCDGQLKRLTEAVWNKTSAG